MKLTMDQFEALQSEFGDDEVRLYSGRGMMGDECVAYTGDDIGGFVVGLAWTLNEGTWTDGELYIGEVGSVVSDLFSGASTDSMGHDQVYYWPRLTVSE